jgi:hypothetical protein
MGINCYFNADVKEIINTFPELEAKVNECLKNKTSHRISLVDYGKLNKDLLVNHCGGDHYLLQIMDKI